MKSERISVTKEFSFDMAHALFNYDGPCKHIHGHTYRLQVTISGCPNQDKNSSKQGMIIDFGDLKKIIKERIIDKYDHALVLNEDVIKELGDSIKNYSENIHLVSYQPTCENLLLQFKNELKEDFVTDEYSLQTVRLYETPSSWAEWTKNG